MGISAEAITPLYSGSWGFCLRRGSGGYWDPLPLAAAVDSGGWKLCLQTPNFLK